MGHKPTAAHYLTPTAGPCRTNTHCKTLLTPHCKGPWSGKHHCITLPRLGLELSAKSCRWSFRNGEGGSWVYWQFLPTNLMQNAIVVWHDSKRKIKAQAKR